jgi:uncharacterized protein GlcG (DUF336 family)
MTPMTQAQACTIAVATLKEGRARGFNPLCCIVLDAGGHPLALLREETASINRPEIARAKAAGCLAFGFGGREIVRRAQAQPAFFAAVGAVLPHGLAPVPGGVLVRDAGGAVIGAVGASGDTSDNDEICVLAGIAQAGLTAETG